jgi:hypothetical protein
MAHVSEGLCPEVVRTPPKQSAPLETREALLPLIADRVMRRRQIAVRFAGREGKAPSPLGQD